MLTGDLCELDRGAGSPPPLPRGFDNAQQPEVVTPWDSGFCSCLSDGTGIEERKGEALSQAHLSTLESHALYPLILPVGQENKLA